MQDITMNLPIWFEYAAVLSGGIAGSMSAVRARYDIFGCMFIACVTGLGGGIIRDVLLQDYGMYAFQNPGLLLSCAIAAIVVFYFGKLATYLDPIVDLLDNISVALWAIIGASKSISAGLGIIPSVVLGTLTAIGGGILRDVLMNRPPAAFQAGPIYGSAALIGCIVYCPLKTAGLLPNTAGALCVGIILLLRYLSLAFGWKTTEPHDHSDTVADAVARPVKFIARKVHVPEGKTARERKNQESRIGRYAQLGKRLYNRISGKWMNDTGEKFQPTVLMNSIDGLVDDEDDSEDLAADSELSDRIFVDRDELYDIIGLDPNPKKSPDASPEKDPFEPQTPEPARSSPGTNNPRNAATGKAQGATNNPREQKLRSKKQGKDK